MAPMNAISLRRVTIVVLKTSLQAATSSGQPTTLPVFVHIAPSRTIILKP